MIDGHTELVGLIGWPVEHSLSPVMHNAAFDALALNWRYLPLPVRPGQVEAAVRGLAALGFRGANVTVPHKETVMSALDTITPNAQQLGAVNTLVIQRNEDGTAVVEGDNTDDVGFIGALWQAEFSPEEGGNAVVVGAGGAARAVIHGLLWAGIETVVVLNRTRERAQSLVSDLSPRLSALPLTRETLVESARTAGLLVNATTVGMWPRVADSIWPDGVPFPAHLTVFDLVYNPLETRLLRQARESGVRVLDGLNMLVLQGEMAFIRWTGEQPPAGVMRAACEQVLK